MEDEQRVGEDGGIECFADDARRALRNDSEARSTGPGGGRGAAAPSELGRSGAISTLVILGLDPRIHAAIACDEGETARGEAFWILGSSPRMTKERVPEGDEGEGARG